MACRTVLVDHSHSVPHMLMVLDGEILEDGRLYGSGDIRVSPAGDRHFLKFTRPSRCLIVEGDVPLGPAGQRQVCHLPGVLAGLRTAADVDRAIEVAGSAEVLDALTGAELPAWLRELEHRRMDGAFIHRNRVQAIARLVGVSREHLTRSYRHHFGTSLSDAIRGRRLREAYDAIVASTRSLTEVADACGFSDQSHMTRQFVDWIGLTPGLLRRRRNITSVQDIRPFGNV